MARGSRNAVSVGVLRWAWPAAVGAGGLVTTAAATATLARFLNRETFDSTNRAIHRFLLSHRSDRGTSILRVMTKVADKPVQLPAALAVGSALVIARRQVLPGILLLVAYPVEARLQLWVWRTVPGERPPSELAVGDPGANPSGGVARAVQIYGLIGYLLHRAWPSRRRGIAWGCGVGAITALESFSRLYLGRHWVSDVVGGWACGVLLLGVGITVERAARPVRTRAER